jgi:hypothetical protein
MGIFDAVIGNLDRHRNNYLVTPDGHLKAIDHGYAFGTSQVTQGRYGGPPHVPELRSFALGGGQIKAGDISVKEQAQIATKLDSIDWNKFFHGTKLNAEERAALLHRASKVSGYLKQGRAHDIDKEFHADAW